MTCRKLTTASVISPRMQKSEPGSKTTAVRHIFSPEEDAKLKKLVEVHGEHSWKTISASMGTRTPRQCRERFRNYLSPRLRCGPWSKEEDELLRTKYRELGPKWSKIAQFFNNRSDVNIKNRWASLTSRAPPTMYYQTLSLPMMPPQMITNYAMYQGMHVAYAPPMQMPMTLIPKPQQAEVPVEQKVEPEPELPLEPIEDSIDFDEFLSDMEGEYFSTLFSEI